MSYYISPVGDRNPYFTVSGGPLALPQIMGWHITNERGQTVGCSCDRQFCQRVEEIGALLELIQQGAKISIDWTGDACKVTVSGPTWQAVVEAENLLETIAVAKAHAIAMMKLGNEKQATERSTQFGEFEAIVKARFPRLQCEQTETRDGSILWQTSDGTVGYFPEEKRWFYREAKSSAGSGATLEEAIADIPSLMDEYDE